MVESIKGGIRRGIGIPSRRGHRDLSRQGWKQQYSDELEALRQIKERIRILED